MSSQNESSFCDFLYNAKDGTVLGRTGKSWSRILLFYLVYYSLLALLFWGSITLYQKTLGTETPSVRTRSDQPGMTVWPQQEDGNGMRGDKDGFKYPFCSNKGEEVEKGLPQHKQDIVRFLKDPLYQWDSSEAKPEGLKDEILLNDKAAKLPGMNQFKTEKDADSKTYSVLDTSKIENLKNNEAIIFLSINRIIGWRTRNIEANRTITPAITNDKFVKNAIYFDCYVYNQKTSESLNSTTAEGMEITPLGNSNDEAYIPEEYLTFEKKENLRDENGNSNAPRAFVAFKITNPYVEDKPFKFRCNALAQNIQIRERGGNGDGYIEFGFEKACQKEKTPEKTVTPSPENDTTKPTLVTTTEAETTTTIVAPVV